MTFASASFSVKSSGRFVWSSILDRLSGQLGLQRDLHRAGEGGGQAGQGQNLQLHGGSARTYHLPGIQPGYLHWNEQNWTFWPRLWNIISNSSNIVRWHNSWAASCQLVPPCHLPPSSPPPGERSNLHGPAACWQQVPGICIFDTFQHSIRKTIPSH